MGKYVAGMIVLLLGIFFFLQSFGLLPADFDFNKLWPLILVGVGIYMIIQGKREAVRKK